MRRLPLWKVCGESYHRVAVTSLISGLYDHTSGDKIVDNVRQGEPGAVQFGERFPRLPFLSKTHAQNDAKGLKAVIALVGGMRLQSLDDLELEIRKGKGAAIPRSLASDESAWRLKRTGRICGLGWRRRLRRRGKGAPTFGIEILPIL
jgi:hypothetical protein